MKLEKLLSMTTNRSEIAKYLFKHIAGHEAQYSDVLGQLHKYCPGHQFSYHQRGTQPSHHLVKLESCMSYLLTETRISSHRNLDTQVRALP